MAKSFYTSTIKYPFKMSCLYVFETTYPNGFRVRGSAGLPLADMLSLKSFYMHCNPCPEIVPANTNTSRLKIKIPVVKKK